jgi:hypothetical protein
MHRLEISGINAKATNLHTKVFQAVQQQLATRQVDVRWVPRRFARDYVVMNLLPSNNNLGCTSQQ